jgi:hypothetical protein
MTEIDHVRSLSAAHVSPGLWSLQRLQNRGATYPGLTLTRLRCAFRVSHPPDALFPPKPFRPISDGSRSWPTVSSLASRVLHSAEVRCLLRCKQRVWLEPPLGFPPLQGCFSHFDGPARHGCLLPWTSIRSAANRPPSPVLRSIGRREPRSSPERTPPLLGSVHLVPASRVSVAEQVSHDPRKRK